MFHEGDDPTAANMFQEVARLTKGVYARFDAGAAQQLRDLLTAAAVYAAGGDVALRDYGDKVGGEVLRLSRAHAGRMMAPLVLGVLAAACAALPGPAVRARRSEGAGQGAALCRRACCWARARWRC